MLVLAVLFSSFAFLANAQNIKNPQYTPPVLNTSRAAGINVFPTPSGTIEMNNAGFNNRILVQEILEPFVNGTSENLTSLITGGQRGLLIKDRETIKGGLWLLGGGAVYPDTDPRASSVGAVGAGFYGDEISRIASAPAASYVGFDNGNINFFAENNMVVGSGFKYPNAKMTITPTGRIGIGTSTPDGIFQVNSAGGNFKIGFGGGNAHHISSDNAIVFNTGGNNFYFRTISNFDPNQYLDVMALQAYPGYTLLRVRGEVRAQKVVVTTDAWRDFVFADDFKLRPLAEVATFIGKNKHLPDVPSEKEIISNGLNLGEMQAIHMQKIEELTLYLLEQDKRATEQDKRIQLLEQKLLQISKKK